MTEQERPVACPVYVSALEDAADPVRWRSVGWADSPMLMSDGSLQIDLHLDSLILTGPSRLIIDTPDQTNMVGMLRRGRRRGENPAADRLLESLVRAHPALAEDMPLPDPLPAAERPCPECAAGKHRNCDHTAWSRAQDAPAPCPCWMKGH